MMLGSRMRSRGRLLIAIAGVVALSAGLGSGLSVVVQGAVIDGAAAIVSAARADDAVVRVAIRWAGQEGENESAARRAAAEQDAAVRETLDALMPSAGLAPQSSIRSEPLETIEFDDALVLVSDERLLDRVDVVAGTWPAAIDEAALAEAAAEALDLRVGDRVTLRGAGDLPVEVTVTALWRAIDSGDPAWAGDPLIERGVDGSVAGPLVIDEQLWRSIQTRPIAQWVSVLEPGRATPLALSELAVGLPTLAQAIDDDPRSQGTGIVVDGGLESTVGELRRAAAGVEAVIPMALALVAVAAVMTLLELQRLLTAVRRDETTLLRSRGASARRLSAGAVVEALIIAAPSASIGAVLGAVTALIARPGSLERAAADVGALLTSVGGSALVVTLVTTVLAVGVTARSARSALRRDTLAESGRATRAVSAAALVLVLVAAGVALGQFLLYRGPLVPTAAHGSTVDVIAALVPVLALLAGALLAVVLVEPLARAIARLASRSVSLTPVLVARPLARSAALLTAPVLLTSLAVGALVVTAAVDATTRSSATAARELVLGAPLTVTGGVLDAEARSVIGGVEGSRELAARPWSATPVLVSDLSIADAPGTLVAMDSSAISRIVASAGGAVERERLAQAIASGPLPSVDVTATAASIRLADEGVRADFWVADARGGVSLIRSGVDGAASLPDSGGPWSVLALDVVAESSTPRLDVVLTGIVVTERDGSETRVPFDEAWNARPDAIPRFGGDVLARTDGRSGFTATVVRRAPGAVRVMPDPTELRLAVTPAVAERFAAAIGDTVTVTVAGSSRRIDGVISDIVRAVPGAPSAASVAVDLRAVIQSQLVESANPATASAMWLAPTDAAPIDRATALLAADELRVLAPRGSTVAVAAESRFEAMADGARIALWTAAVGTFLLAISTVAVVSRAISGTRQVDVVVLRAIGVGARAQRRARALELAAALLAAVLAGLAVGVATSALLVGDLARALLIDAPPALAVAASIDPITGGLVLLGLAGALAVLAGGAGSSAARQVRTLSAREVLR